MDAVSADDLQALLVSDVRQDGTQVKVIELRASHGGALPAFTAGAHVDVALPLPDGHCRQYSLCNDPAELHRYVIAVAMSEHSRGGSRYLHEQVKPGMALSVGRPRNHFALAPDKGPALLLAGGIGITPLLAMARQLEREGRAWQLHYGVRSQAYAALLPELNYLGAVARHGRWHLHSDQAGTRMDLAALIGQACADTHFYCCGPAAMLEHYRLEALRLGIDGERLHLEHFAAVTAAATDGGFTVVLARSGTEIAVAEGQSILDALEDRGVDVSWGCREGVCGDCETRVLEGIPDHRDAVLSEQEKQRNASMMICCSGCKGARLVLDL
ncbi:MAG: PDR/VanB family oxidoreductase [Pseudomonas sp.]